VIRSRFVIALAAAARLASATQETPPADAAPPSTCEARMNDALQRHDVAAVYAMVRSIGDEMRAGRHPLPDDKLEELFESARAAAWKLEAPAGHLGRKGGEPLCTDRAKITLLAAMTLDLIMARRDEAVARNLESLQELSKSAGGSSALEVKLLAQSARRDSDWNAARSEFVDQLGKIAVKPGALVLLKSNGNPERRAFPPALWDPKNDANQAVILDAKVFKGGEELESDQVLPDALRSSRRWSVLYGPSDGGRVRIAEGWIVVRFWMVVLEGGVHRFHLRYDRGVAAYVDDLRVLDRLDGRSWNDFHVVDVDLRVGLREVTLMGWNGGNAAAISLCVERRADDGSVAPIDFYPVHDSKLERTWRRLLR